MREITIEGWCAYNRDEERPLINEISFEATERIAKKCWGNRGQKIRKCKIIIEED